MSHRFCGLVQFSHTFTIIQTLTQSSLGCFASTSIYRQEVVVNRHWNRNKALEKTETLISAKRVFHLKQTVLAEIIWFAWQLISVKNKRPKHRNTEIGESRNAITKRFGRNQTETSYGWSLAGRTQGGALSIQGANLEEGKRNPYSANNIGVPRMAQLFPIFDSGEKFLAREKGAKWICWHDTCRAAAAADRVAWERTESVWVAALGEVFSQPSRFPPRKGCCLPAS